MFSKQTLLWFSMITIYDGQIKIAGNTEIPRNPKYPHFFGRNYRKFRRITLLNPLDNVPFIPDTNMSIEKFKVIISIFEKSKYREISNSYEENKMRKVNNSIH